MNQLFRIAAGIAVGLGALLLPAATIAKETASCCQTRNVITIIVDGARWEEVFHGIDPRFLQPEGEGYFRQPGEPKKLFLEKFWRDNDEARRAALMPFFWSTIATDGQLLGDRKAGSTVRLRNGIHISYPGHSEFLTGKADDARITSNAFKPNPNVTILEYLQGRPAFKGKVAALSTWDAYPFILNVERSGLPVHSPSHPLDFAPGNDRVRLLNELLTDTGPSLHSDAITFHLALEYLKEKRPRFLHLSFQNADRTAHAGQYDDYAYALRSTDSYIRRIWEWVQADPAYRNHTTLVVAADHGRGAASLELWKTHGTPGYKPVGPNEINPTEGDQYSWLAIIGPDTPRLGARHDIPDVEIANVTGGIAKLLGESFAVDAGSESAMNILMAQSEGKRTKSAGSE